MFKFNFNKVKRKFRFLSDNLKNLKHIHFIWKGGDTLKVEMKKKRKENIPCSSNKRHTQNKRCPQDTYTKGECKEKMSWTQAGDNKSWTKELKMVDNTSQRNQRVYVVTKGFSTRGLELVRCPFIVTIKKGESILNSVLICHEVFTWAGRN